MYDDGIGLLCSANAAGEDFVPYFEQVINVLKVYLVNTETDDQRRVQIQAVGQFCMHAIVLSLLQVVHVVGGVFQWLGCR